MKKMTQETILSEVLEKSSFDFAQFQKEAMEKLKNGQPLIGAEGILTPLIKQLIEASLEAEMQTHLEGCEAQDIANRRNSKTRKQVKSATGTFELETPRD